MVVLVLASGVCGGVVLFAPLVLVWAAGFDGGVGVVDLILVLRWACDPSPTVTLASDIGRLL